jgi:cytochrome P450
MTLIDFPRSEPLDLTSLGEEFVNDPYPILTRLREEEPVRRVVYHGLPAWFVTRFADAQAVYTEPLLSADKAHGTDEARAVPWIEKADLIGLGRNMLYLDPPEHSRLRRLVSRTFTARRVENQREFIRVTAERLLDEAVRRGGVADVLHDFSIPLASQVIMNMIGVPELDIDTFAGHSQVFLSTDPADEARRPAALAWIQRYITELVETKRAAPADDLLSELIAVREEGDRLDEVELGSMTLVLIMAGFETTACLIANGLLALLTHPDQLAILRAEPELMPDAVDEIVRWNGAALASVPRFAAGDVTIGGVRIRRGEAVVVSWPAANRDPRRFTDPDTFDVRRTGHGHLGFAHGIHYCLGAPLARMETQIAFSALLGKEIRLAVPAEELSWRVTPNVRGLKRLPVRISQRSQ